MGNVVAFEWLSGDGVFDADFMEEWFFPYDSPERRKFIKETYREANAFLMGRNTYEMLAPYWSQLPDEDMDGLAGVLTHTPKFIASHGPQVAHWGDTTILKGDIKAQVKKLKSEVSNIMIIGSATLAESLAQVGLIDEYKLLVQPFIMGTGKRFFTESMKTPLELVEVKKLHQDMVLLHYRVKK
ncbi:riboflavin biosynthesis protein RibD [Leptospira kobayashii]|uniref:Riboflavin biosynthesis protein RibD n=1 Tax=Leptospira kobayashii TaxID=1917830 RepID=A0ABM7URS1_9LEPT|nr:dihydrofolate reductase family protein [Leptospira kobayashii]BDA78171.1 riboflavin biosynthesis protein RibD [Leptospira kobayashii]